MLFEVFGLTDLLAWELWVNSCFDFIFMLFYSLLVVTLFVLDYLFEFWRCYWICFVVCCVLCLCCLRSCSLGGYDYLIICVFWVCV